MLNNSHNKENDPPPLPMNSVSRQNSGNNSNNSRNPSETHQLTNSQSGSTVLACNIESNRTDSSSQNSGSTHKEHSLKPTSEDQPGAQSVAKSGPQSGPQSTPLSDPQSSAQSGNNGSSSSGKATSQCSHDSSATLAITRNRSKHRRIKNYEIREKVGGGSFGTVKMVYCTKTYKKLAMKEIVRSRLAKEGLEYQIDEERNYLKLLKHCPFVIDYVTAFENNDLSMTVMEFGEKGDIKTYNEKYGYMDYVLMKFFTVEIISGLVYLQDRNIVHRDLKPENILIMDNWHIKLCDFMTAITMNDLNNNCIKMKDLEEACKLEKACELEEAFKLEKACKIEEACKLEEACKIESFSDKLKSKPRNKNSQNSQPNSSPPVVAKVTSYPNSPVNKGSLHSPTNEINTKINNQDKPSTVYIAPQDRHKFVGTTIYMAPETAKGMTSRDSLIRAAARREGKLIAEQNSPMIDNWALGCVIYFMLTGEPPFRNVNDKPKEPNVPNALYSKNYNKFPQLKYLDTYRYTSLSFVDYHVKHVIGYNCEMPPSMNEDVQQVLNHLLHPEPENRALLKPLLKKSMFSNLESWECEYIHKKFQCPKEHTGQFLAEDIRDEFQSKNAKVETKWDFPAVIATKDQMHQDRMFGVMADQTTMSSQQSSDTGGMMMNSGGFSGGGFSGCMSSGMSGVMSGGMSGGMAGMGYGGYSGNMVGGPKSSYEANKNSYDNKSSQASSPPQQLPASNSPPNFNLYKNIEQSYGQNTNQMLYSQSLGQSNNQAYQQNSSGFLSNANSQHQTLKSSNLSKPSTANQATNLTSNPTSNLTSNPTSTPSNPTHSKSSTSDQISTVIPHQQSSSSSSSSPFRRNAPTVTQQRVHHPQPCNSNDTPLSGDGLQYWYNPDFWKVYLERQKDKDWLMNQSNLSKTDKKNWQDIRTWDKVCGPDEIIVKMGIFKKRRGYYSIKTRMFLLTYSPTHTNGFKSRTGVKNHGGLRFAYYDMDKFKKWGFNEDFKVQKQCYKGEIPMSNAMKRHHISSFSNFKNLNIETPGRVYYLNNYKDMEAVNWKNLLIDVMTKLYGSDFDDEDDF